MTPEEAHEALVCHFARPNCETCSQVAQTGLVLWRALASQRQTIIDEMVRPLMDALKKANTCRASMNTAVVEVMDQTLAAVESKLSGEKQKETKPQ